MNYYIKRIVLALTQWIPDKYYLQILHKVKVHRKLNLENPATFTDKMQWLKLYDCQPQYHSYADKLTVRKYVKDRIGEDHLIPQIAVYNNPEEIVYEELPDRFILKCNHDSASTLICLNKKDFDWKKAKIFLHKRQKLPFYLEGRENVYKGIKPLIICESFIGDDKPPMDYKVFCFHGKPRMIQVDQERFSDHKRVFYSTDWKLLNVHDDCPVGIEIEKPKCLKELLALSEKLSAGIRFVRADFYVVDSQIFFGEMTFYPSAGFTPFFPEKEDRMLASWI